MGCAPSIHVSQSGIVYCREDIGDRSSGARASSLSEVINHIHSEQTSGLSTSVRKTRISSLDKGLPSVDLRNKMDAAKEEKNTITFGPMKIFQHQMSILLVFPHEDPQCSALLLAAHRGSYPSKLCTTVESALEYFNHYHPQLVIIDLRSPRSINGKELCRNICEIGQVENAVLVGIVKPSIGEDVPSVLPWLEIGFNRVFNESHNVGQCFNELLMLEHGEIKLLTKKRAAACLLIAAENCSDSIEIASFDTERGDCVLQYANHAFERNTGYSRKEMIGRATRLGPYPSNCKDPSSGLDEQSRIQLENGKSKEWKEYISHKKNGEAFKQNLKIIPILGQEGKITNLVAVKQENRESRVDKDGIIFNSSPRPSISSTKLEPYMTIVINMINSAKEGSLPNVAAKLSRAIEILQTKELYSIGNETLDDDVSPYEGLVANRRPSGGALVTGHRSDSAHFPGHNTLLHLTEAPAEILEALEGESLWDYNIIELERLTNQKPLFYLGMVIFSRFNAQQFLQISKDCLMNWLRMIESNYHERNTYHNSTHAADVLHSTAYFLMKERVKNTLEPMDEIAALIAATVHDIDHPGFTNSFLCNASDRLAVLYNDIAVLESHHAALSFQKTREYDSSNIFRGLRPDDYRALRQSIIDMVMATEMTRHFEHLSKFVNSINKRRTSSIGEVTPVGGRATPESSSSSLQTPENRTLIKRMLIKCADISNPARPRPLCETWARRIAEEYFHQTEEEKKLGLPVVMPVFDRLSCNVPRSQVWFIDYFVSDLYDAWDAFAHVPETIRHLTNNYEYWKQKAEEQDDLVRQNKITFPASQ
ncbi:high affinity cAMP-specific and IBMX-insensitive 3',5'-cyclic phosphodiesterase 8A-like isoform X2 [Xenia sp. Carnegie-2017]|uniref:high affinity cAMP-specific and IBMX-insensitive 3',5'-cyclic phosphodiesterase 8A-like isoform X2 n=1 Tax=Xenia sp. Carnegie-2017 TaxID=2897299 RepID=UPI001F0496A5|nr:high affinity cAMP-specific and IBMX-insensitive 3',5'-cyclic phosphodiesterase 8A-like isoform X2 [Xenia sp. Carnegie-2017]